MNQATQIRYNLAQQVATCYAASPKVAAVALAGSVARGWADDHSDIELDIYWAEPPTDEDRRAIIAQAGGQVDLFWGEPPPEAKQREIFAHTKGKISQLWPFEDDEWSEHFYVRGVCIGVSGFLVATIDHYFNDVFYLNTIDDDRQMRLAAIQHAIPFYGEPVLGGWQKKCGAYPREIATSLIEEALTGDEMWWTSDMWVTREAYLPLIHLLHHMQLKLLRILLALNHIYLPDPRFKWADRLIDQMTIKPENLAERLKTIFKVEGHQATQMIETLLHEILDLVKAHHPEIDIAFFKSWYAHRRPMNKSL